MNNLKKYVAFTEHAQCRLLVFNDSPVDVRGVVGLLEGMGYTHVDAVTDPRHVMATLSEGAPYDALIMDLRMPHLDGLKNIYLVRGTFSAAELPILAVSDAGSPELCNAALLAGANDHLVRPIDPIDVALRVRNMLTIHDIYKTGQDIQNNLEREVAARTAKLHLLIENGLLMSMTRDRSALFRHTLFEGQRLLHCDAATLYLVTAKNTLRFSMRTRDDDLAATEIALYDPETGLPNERYASTKSALHKKTIRIDDVYAQTEFDLSGTRSFDASTGYRTVSTLTVPLIPRGGEVIGVLQFINKLDPDTNAVIPFPQDLVPLVEALAAQAAVTLANLALNDAQRAQSKARHWTERPIKNLAR